MILSYDEISPITKNKSVLVEAFDNGYMKICMESGYMTYDGLIFGSDTNEDFSSSSPTLIRESQFVDVDTKQVWYRAWLAMGDVVLYPTMYDGDYMWAVGKYSKLDVGIDLTNNLPYRVVGNEKIEVIDEANSKLFEETQFIDAYDYFNKLCNETID